MTPNQVDKYPDNTTGMDYAIDLLSMEPPRTINRVMAEAEIFCRTYRDTAGLPRINFIRPCDILLLSYCKIQCPIVIKFLQKTFEEFVDSNKATNIVKNYQRHEKMEKYPTGYVLVDWIAEELGIKEEEKKKINWQDIKNIISICAHNYIDHLSKNAKPTLDYINTTSDPRILREYLTLKSDDTRNLYKQNVEIYYQHKHNENYLNNINNEDFLEYAWFLSTIAEETPNENLSTAIEIYKRISGNAIKLTPHKTSNSIRGNFIYAFIVNVNRYVSLKILKNQSVENAIELLDKIFMDAKIDTGSKYLIIGSLISENTGLINLEFKQIFNKRMYTPPIRNSLFNVFSEVEQRYFNGTEVIYEKEENFFYVLYQSWSGETSNSSEMVKLKDAALRNINQYPKVIEMYWDNFPYIENCASYDELKLNTQSNLFWERKTANELFMPLKTLMGISGNISDSDTDLLKKIIFWKGIANDAASYQKYLQDFDLKTKPFPRNTLRARLKDLKILP